MKRGVYQHKDGSFIATLGTKYLGYFSSEIDADNARTNAEIERYGKPQERMEIIIDGDVAKIPLHGRGKFHGYTTIDVADVELCRPISWTLSTQGYAVGRPKGSSNAIKLNRYLFFGVENNKTIIDHVNRDKLDNRRENLRMCSQRENGKNTSLKKNNTSGAKGVSKASKGKFRARIWLDRKEIHIGTFCNVFDAAKAYDRAAEIMHGEFAAKNMMPTPVSEMSG
jgi:hypothetical protein